MGNNITLNLIDATGEYFYIFIITISEFEAHENLMFSILLSTEQVGINICSIVSLFLELRISPSLFGREQILLSHVHIVPCNSKKLYESHLRRKQIVRLPPLDL